MNKLRVFIDTNVIFEAFRINCWTALSQRYDLETVEACVIETQQGNPNKPGYIPVPLTALRGGLSQAHTVTKREVDRLVISHPSCALLDNGEKHLWARLYADQILQTSVVVASTADKAAIVSAHLLGWLDHLVSLESLAKNIGVPASSLNILKEQYQENWLSKIKFKARMGIIP